MTKTIEESRLLASIMTKTMEEVCNKRYEGNKNVRAI